tara:strand:- start:8863 stop:9783 length:921 start_codon:yes stop_codon:yes gene_type:complete
MGMTRREFSLSGTVSIFGLMTGVPPIDFRTRASGENDFDLMREVNKYRKIDAYATSNMTLDQLRDQIEFADRLSIEKMFVGMPMLPIKATPEEFRSINDKVIKGVKAYPDRLVGEFTINPTYKKEAIDEINRCVDNGLVGTRLYNQVKISDPLYEPIIEKLSELKMIVFMHGECQLGVGGYRMKYDAGKFPSTSTPEDFVAAAKKFPDANFQFAHIGGGGDWECMCKTFEHTPNIYVDTGGSNNEENMIDFALKYLGEDRLFFGTDNSYYQSVGKVLASNLNEGQKRKLFFDNYNALLKKGGFGVN